MLSDMPQCEATLDNVKRYIALSPKNVTVKKGDILEMSLRVAECHFAL
jgi:hypothetical protein